MTATGGREDVAYSALIYVKLGLIFLILECVLRLKTALISRESHSKIIIVEHNTKVTAHKTQMPQQSTCSSVAVGV